MELSEKSLLNEHYNLRRYSESIEAEPLFADPHTIEDRYASKLVEPLINKEGNKKEDIKKDYNKYEDFRTEDQKEDTTEFEHPIVDQQTNRKLSHTVTTPSLSPWINQENRLFEIGEISLGKNKYTEETETRETDSHQEPRERRLDSFSFEESSFKPDLKKYIEESASPKPPTTAGLVVKIDQSKINNNEQGAVTIQNNTQHNIKKKKEIQSKRRARFRIGGAIE